MNKGKIVHRIEDGMNPREVHCTTYQMRNPFLQLRDAVANELDVMNYIQHSIVAKLAPKEGAILDVCCGRGLLLPFLRYQQQFHGLYLGVDIKRGNAKWAQGFDPRRQEETKSDWGFETKLVVSDVAAMAKPVKAAMKASGFDDFNLIVYTSSIEHMQPKAQAASLVECGKLSSPSTTLFLTCPVTHEGGDGYETQYRAHVYEPSRKELDKMLAASGWQVQEELGLVTKCSIFRKILIGENLVRAEALYAGWPRAFAIPAIAFQWPETSCEIGLVCSRMIHSE